MLDFSLRFDTVVEVVSLVTALLVTAFSLYAYHRTHARRHLAFAFAFAVLALASGSNLIFNYLVQLEIMHIPLRGYLGISPYYDLWRFFFHLFSLTGYITIFLIAERIDCPRQMTLLYLLAPLTAWTAHEIWPAYSVISVIVLAMAVYHFYKTFLETGVKNTRNIAVGFGIILVSELVFAFSSFGLVFYNLGHVLRLLGFLSLLYTVGCIYWSTGQPIASPMMRERKKKK